MKGEGRDGRTSGPWILGALLVAALALRIAFVSHGSGDLLPRPDALEYAAGAASLARGDGLALEIDGHRYPSRYPPGMAVLLAPVVAVAGDPAYAYVGVLALGIVSIALVWSLTRRLDGTMAAFFATVVVAISPFHALLSALVMSEIPSLCAVTFVVLAFAGWARGGRRDAHLLWIGASAGLAAAIRAPNVLVLAPLCAWLVLVRERPWRARSKALLLLLAGCAVPVALEAWHRRALLGDVPSGYHYWRPDDFDSWRTWYHPRFALAPARPGWTTGNLLTYGAALVGWRPGLWTPVSAALALLGAWHAARRWREPVALACLGFPLVTLAFYLPYFSRERRMMLVALPFLAALAGIGAASVLRSVPATAWRRVLLVALLGGAFLGVGLDGRLGAAGKVARSLQKIDAGGSAAVHQALRRAVEAVPPDAVVVTDLARLHVGLYLREPSSLELVTLRIDTRQPEGRAFDEQVKLIRRHGLRPLDGADARPSVLLHDDAIDASTLALLRAADAAGRPIELWLTHRCIQPAMLERLAAIFELASGPGALEPLSLHRFRVKVRPGGAS